MSGLYNTLFGIDPMAMPLLMALDINHRDVPRFRDCFLFHDGQSVVIYTRTGGGNREEFAAENATMTRWPGYLRDEDDSYDSTYALFHFAIPEVTQPSIAGAIKNGWGVNPSERWRKTIEEIGKL